MLKILVINRKTEEQKTYQLSKNVILIGRSRQCDIQLDSETVSRKHAQIHYRGNKLMVEDLGSGNGTMVNQKKVPPKEKMNLFKGDHIHIEEFTIEWESDAPLPEFTNENPMDSTDPDILEMKMIKKVIGALGSGKKPKLTMITEPFQDKTLVLEDDDKTYVIGREPDCDLSLDSPVVSRRHAEIALKWGTVVLKDLGSKNGCFVNGEAISGEASLKDGDAVTIGTLEGKFEHPEQFNLTEIEHSLKKEEEAKQKQAEDAARAEAEKRQAEEAQKQKEAAAAKPEKQEEKTQEPKPKEEPKSETEEILEDIPDEKPKPKPEKPKKPSFLKGLSAAELALFGFGAFVILVVIFALVFVLK